MKNIYLTWGVQACYFGNLDFDLWVGGDGLDIYQQLEGWSKNGAKNQNLKQKRKHFEFVTIRFVLKKQAFSKKGMSKSNEKWPSYAH